MTQKFTLACLFLAGLSSATTAEKCSSGHSKDRGHACKGEGPLYDREEAPIVRYRQVCDVVMANAYKRIEVGSILGNKNP